MQNEEETGDDDIDLSEHFFELLDSPVEIDAKVDILREMIGSTPTTQDIIDLFSENVHFEDKAKQNRLINVLSELTDLTKRNLKRIKKMAYEQEDPNQIDYYKISEKIRQENHILAPYEYRDSVFFYEDGYYKRRGAQTLTNEKVVAHYEDRHITKDLRAKSFNLINTIILSKAGCELSDLGDKCYLNLKNGILDLEALPRINFIEHTPDIKNIIRIPVNFNPFARCKASDRLISQILQGEKENFYKFIGDIFSRQIREDRAFLMVGEGSNGKSTLLELLLRLVGKENAAKISLKKIENGRWASGDLENKIVNLFDDLDKGKIKNSSQIKTLISEKYISGERKYEGRFIYENTCKHIFATNKVFETKDDTKAFFRRWVPFRCNLQISEEEKDKDILDKCLTENEKSGILNKALIHLVKLREEGYETLTHSEMKEWWTQESRPVYAFCKDYALIGDGYKVKQAEFLEAYNTWADAHNFESLTKWALTNRIKKNFATIETKRERRGGIRKNFYIGIDLRLDVDDFTQETGDAGLQLEEQDEEFDFNDPEFQGL
jgi:P4 family phage/plasmid primase-like protien